MAKSSDIHSLDREELVELVVKLQSQLKDRESGVPHHPLRGSSQRRRFIESLRARKDLSDPVRRRRVVREQLAEYPREIQDWVADKLMPAIWKTTKTQREVYVGELTAIGRSLASEIGVTTDKDPYKLALMLAALITYEPDDEDEDEAEPDLPQVGDLVHS